MSKTSSVEPVELLGARPQRLARLAVERVGRARPVRGSRSPPTAAMYCASPRTPCSGPKSAASRTPGAAWRRSAACTSLRVTAVGLQTSPTAPPGERPEAALREDLEARDDPAAARALAPEREAEREAARLVLRVRGIAEVPVGAGADVAVVDRVLQHLDRVASPAGFTVTRTLRSPARDGTCAARAR